MNYDPVAQLEAAAGDRWPNSGSPLDTLAGHLSSLGQQVRDLDLATRSAGMRADIILAELIDLGLSASAQIGPDALDLRHTIREMTRFSS